MSKKTIVVSDFSGKEVYDPVQVILIYEDGTRVELDANANEVTGLAEQGQRVRPRGRPRKRRSQAEEQPAEEQVEEQAAEQAEQA